MCSPMCSGDPRDVYDPEFNCQRDYLTRHPGGVRDYSPHPATPGVP